MRRTAKAQVQHNFSSDQILYLISDGNYSYLYLCDGIKILSSRTLKWHSFRWPHFIRVHKKSLINPSQVHSVVQQSSITAQVLMKDGARFQVGRRRISQVVHSLGEIGFLQV